MDWKKNRTFAMTNSNFIELSLNHAKTSTVSKKSASSDISLLIYFEDVGADRTDVHIGRQSVEHTDKKDILRQPWDDMDRDRIWTKSIRRIEIQGVPQYSL